MGTRADFYVRNEAEQPKIKWLGSIGWDGYPDGISEDLLKAETESDFIGKIHEFLNHREDKTLPENGWPWPWDDSRTTDYSYIFENGKVMASCFGHPLFDPLIEQDEEEETKKMEGYFPDMAAIKNVNMGKGSGLIIISL